MIGKSFKLNKLEPLIMFGKTNKFAIFIILPVCDNI